ncbi:hypothetical protein NS29R_08305 [Enterobacter hormaechei subsp. xiangfangensis]|uniref:N-6 DNA methylase n=2 Tax=Enterobacteriaceae TaxID=543 RepID=UPI000736E119|nr:N-6 DNA methylase [Enterobacter hormaechei]HAV1934592.1 N-6 DNA methylase [Enterobacter hormaechei subsp. steigerwaltii]KTQ57735.1 hypothetical protein NS23R_08385 [Enterobacter hormaechei]KTQ62834.1 hypothetical protein NS34R_14005 [Enterobacter hormaechei]KTQ64331.1 hypothetical protein NS28R_02845 [Enterobacter hormaechei subsp. xiangfangensis]KTQ70382.1 hypothetical protein NS19R_08670 [Enterobacter hormaechei subsp. xiangfangensis]
MNTDSGIKDKKRVNEETMQCIMFMKALSAGMPDVIFRTFVRDFFSAFLLLRWIDIHDAEGEAVALFEEKDYHPLLPSYLRFQNWPHPITSTDLTAFVSSLIAYLARHDRQEIPVMNALNEIVPKLYETHLAQFTATVNWIASYARGMPDERQMLSTMFETVLDETEDMRAGYFTAPDVITHLVAEIMSPEAGEKVYDPCSGLGGFLLSAFEKVRRSRPDTGISDGGTSFVGCEARADVFLYGVTRLILAGATNIHLMTKLPSEGTHTSRDKYDVVMTTPATGAKYLSSEASKNEFLFPDTDSTGQFIQHVFSSLKTEGRAAVVVPDGFLFRGGADRELRQYLLKEGAVEAVVALPAGTLSRHSTLRGNLLILRKNRVKRSESIRMVDASLLFERSPGSKTFSITQANIDILVNASTDRDVRRTYNIIQDGTYSFFDISSPPERIFSSLEDFAWDVTVDELSLMGWDLTPRRRNDKELYQFFSDTLDETSKIASLVSVSEVFPGRVHKSTELFDSPLNETDAVGYIRIKNLFQGKITRPSSWISASRVSADERLREGDILLSRSGTIGKAAMVDGASAGSVASHGFYVLRVNSGKIEPGYLLAYLHSPVCQTWLLSRSRGTAIQHIHREALKMLPIPVLPHELQNHAAAQFHDFGTSVQAFILHMAGNSSSEQLTQWLSDTEGRLPEYIVGIDDTPSLNHMETLVVGDALSELHERGTTVRWLPLMIRSLDSLAGVSKIPPGAGLMTVLMDAERSFKQVMDSATGHFPHESRARMISERMRIWLRAAISDMVDKDCIQLVTHPEYLNTGSFEEFSVELQNRGVLPLRNVVIRTEPDWGGLAIPWLTEKQPFVLPMHGDTPKREGVLSWRITWHAVSLSGMNLKGETELVLSVSDSAHRTRAFESELGGSPYVTGSPLEPAHGHSVFYGREELIDKVCRQVATQGNVVLLEGNRRAGKTSILKHLEGLKAIPGWLAVYCSLQGGNGDAQKTGVPTVEVFRCVAHSIASSLSKMAVDVPLPDGGLILSHAPVLGRARIISAACAAGIRKDSSFSDFRDYLELVLTAPGLENTGILLMLDEFDKLQEGIDNGVTSPQVPENIRFLIQTYARFSAILTGSRRLKRLREEYWSALYGLGTSIPVTALDVESARKVVTEPVQGRLAFSRGAIERLLELTARHPYLMQCLCNRIFDFAVQMRSRSVGVTVVDEAARELVRDNEHFASLWDYSSQGPVTGRHRRHLILLRCAQAVKHGDHLNFASLQELLIQSGIEITDEALDIDLTYLRELELIAFSGDLYDSEYALTIPLMADWIEQHQDADVIVSQARTESEEENV